MLFLVDIKQKFRNWRSKRHYEHDAYLDTLSYDLENNRFILNRKTVKQKDIKPSDKMVTNDTYHYFNTPLPKMPRKVVDDQGHILTTPINDYQYIQNNDINDALTAIVKEPVNRNIILLAVLGGLGVAVVGYLLMSVVFSNGMV